MAGQEAGAGTQKEMPGVSGKDPPGERGRLF